MSKYSEWKKIAVLLFAGGVLFSCVKAEKSARPAADTSVVAAAPAADSSTDSAATDENAGTSAVDIDNPLPISAEHANAAPTDWKRGAEALLKAYPEFIKRIEDNKVLFTDGTESVYDDGKAKDWNALLDDSDIEDMFFTPYNSEITPPRYLSDAGRSRNEALFKKMYGDTSAAVRRNLTNVRWFGQNVQFSRVNGAADSLRKVEAELSKYPELEKYMKSSGTFNWRPVRGAKRMSAHSYGIAFDIAVPYSDYWQWSLKTNNELAKVPYRNRFPRRIVEIFERHGFIWGGAWYHYDTMHFEFRPELLEYSRLISSPAK